MSTKYYQGKYIPKNPSKYLGDPTKITYRSSWEVKCMVKFDTHPNVTAWGSEELVIPYKSPIDGKWHRYFTDFYVEQIDKEGKKKKLLIEIKPFKQTLPPDRKTVTKKDGKIKKAYINEVKTWGVNQAKWEAAKKVCDKKGWEFVILTEREIFGKS